MANIGLSITKLLVPLALLGFGATGLFLAYAASVAVATTISFLAIEWHQGVALHRPHRHQGGALLLTGTYLASIALTMLNIIPPIMVASILEGEPAAYFNLSITIPSLLYVIAHSQAMVAAVSYDDKRHTAQLRNVTGHTAAILLPGMAVVMLFSPVVLMAFDPQYAAHDAGTLRIVVRSAIPLAASAILRVILKLRHRVRTLVMAEIACATAMIGMAIPLMHLLGVTGAVWSWLIGNMVMAAILTAPAVSAIGRPKRSVS